jgi:hypothetical protein
MIPAPTLPEATVTTLRIDFTEAADEYLAALEAHLISHGHQVDRTDGSILVSASTIDECNRLGTRIADFIVSRDGAHPLRIDGPGADSTLYELKTWKDAEVIASMCRSAARLE